MVIKVFDFPVTQSPQLFCKEDTNVMVRIKAEQGIYIGNDDVTIQDGFPLSDGYHTFNMQANDFLYVIGSYASSHMRVMIYSANP